MPFKATRPHVCRIASIEMFATLFFIQGSARAALIASYPMNEASWSSPAPQVTDISGNGYNGIALGGANTVTDTMFGRAGSFNGSNQYVGVNGSLSIQGARSIVAWVNPPANSIFLGLPIITGGAPGAGDFFGIGGTGGEQSNAPQYALYVDHWGEGAGGGKWSNMLVTPNQWNFVALTYDGSTTRNFYINGLPAGSVTAKGLYNYDLSTYTIGGNVIGGTTTLGSFPGRMHDVRIYNSALTASELHDIYVASIPEPSSLVLILMAGALGGLIPLYRRVRCTTTVSI